MIHTHLETRSLRTFTLIELLICIAIIAILASLKMKFYLTCYSYI